MCASRHAVSVVLLLIATTHALGAEPAPLFPFVLPWDDASKSAVDVSGLNDRPAGKLGPVVARDGHLYTGAKRFRIVGVNLCFGANFPTHADAQKVAARMSKFGINCVRFHHMDMQTPPSGLVKADKATLDPGQLDKLDYLISRLKAHGIYADLNLHVSRTYPDAPTWEGMPSFLKGIDNVDPRLIALQKNYARDLLTHRNPYTKNRYADEPAVALVEINNENALIHEWWNGGLDTLPNPYRSDFATRWNDWLKTKYRDTASLQKAWGATEEPLGPELLSNGDFARGTVGWTLERHEGAQAEAKVVGDSPRAFVVTVAKPGSAGWHVQVNQSGLKFRSDHPYTLTFRARADAPRRVALGAGQAHEPWQPLWTTEAALSTQWKTFQYVFRPSETDDRARVGFSNLAASAGRVEFAAVSLRRGGVVGLDPKAALGSLPFIPKTDYSRLTPEAQRDWIAFLWDQEERYWTGMYRYLKDDLKVVAPVLGTQMGWSPAPIQAKLDVVDSHAYWQHPNFPGRPWDMNNWTVNNLPMTGRADGGTLPALALSRVVGKPFICTEYNHSAPNTFAAETLPLIFAFAALQDWDGVFVFAYSHRGDDWDAGRISSFFDIDQDPVKMASLPAAAALFLRGDLASTARPITATVGLAPALDVTRRTGPGFRADHFGIERNKALSGSVGMSLPGIVAARTPPTVGRLNNPSWNWHGAANDEYVTVDTARSKLLATRQDAGKGHDLSGVVVTPGNNRQRFAVITLTALDAADFRSPGRILITATGQVENTGMRWTSPAHESVGADWGRRPSLVEGIPAVITFPVAANRLRAFALDEHGRRRRPLTITGESPHATLKLGPEQKTLWYEAEIVP